MKAWSRTRPSTAPWTARLAILAREAAMRQTRLTMEELLKENKKLEFDTSGLKA